MKIPHLAGFGPIGPDPAATLQFWSKTMGIPFEELAPGYHHTENLEGTRVFALWPLEQAAEATFGTAEWPADRPVPQAWIEFEVASPDAVAEAAAELEAAGQEILGAHEEEWGQTAARQMSPKGYSWASPTCRAHTPDEGELQRATGEAGDGCRVLDQMRS